MSTGLVIMLPQGLGVSGVNTWAVRLANALVARGRPAALGLHNEPIGHARLAFEIDPRVHIIDARSLPPIEQADGDIEAFVNFYRQALGTLGWRAPIVLSPNLLGDCYGIAAALCDTEPERYRVVAWHHSDIAYNDAVLAHYEPCISRFVGVSERITDRLRGLLSHRKADIEQIAYGVPIPLVPERDRSGPLRLLYTGRIEHEQKRVSALMHCSRRLDELRVAHTLTLIGDGPAAPEIDAEIGKLPHANRTGACAPTETMRRLLEADIFVLASRYEGLSISMLEALACGCVPVMTRVASGAEEAVEHGVNGIFADAGPDDDEEDAGDALAEAIAKLDRNIVVRMSCAARTIGERYSIERHADAACAVIDACANDEPRRWRDRQPYAFTAGNGQGSGSVPPDAENRLAKLLAGLSGRRIVVHGSGRHTTELSDVFTGSAAVIAAVCDDDRAKHGGECLGAPVIAPEDAAEHGATHVVISSWLHQDAIWRRRGVYERQGIRVHRIYDELSHRRSA